MCLSSVGAPCTSSLSSGLHVGAALGSRGDVLSSGSGIPGTVVVSDGHSRPAERGALGSIRVGRGVGLGMGGLGSGGGGDHDTGGGVLPGAMSVYCSSADLDSSSGASGRGDGLWRSFLCAPGGIRFSGVDLTCGVQRTRDIGLGNNNDVLGGTLSVARQKLRHVGRRRPRHG
jgi:hypothetical protein